MAKTKQPKNEPRTIEHERAWYYVNRASIDLCLRSPNVLTLTRRLTRTMLKRMLAELDAPHAD